MRYRSLASASLSATAAATVVAALGAALLGAPGLAYAEDGTPSPTPTATVQTTDGDGPAVGDITLDADDNGFLDIALTSDSGVTRVTADLTPLHASGNPEPTAVAGFTLVSGTAQDGVWRSGRLSGLSGYGEFTVGVSAQDADGDTTSAPAAGAVDFEKQPVFSGRSITPAVLDVAHPKLTAQGTISLFDPATGLTAPLTGQTVYLGAGNLGLSGTTDNSGHYSFTSAPASYNVGSLLAVGISFWLPKGDGGNRSVLVDSATLSTVVSPSRIRLDHTSTRINYGTKVSISGIVEYQSGGVWKPAPAVPLDMTNYATTKSASNGRFTLTYPYLPSDDGSWTVETSSSDANPYLKPTHASFKVDVVNKTYVCLCTSWMSEYSTLHIEGNLTTSNAKTPANKRIYLQQSANGKTGWKTLGWFNAGAHGAYKLDAYVAVPKGYWRLYYAGQADYLPGTSNAVHFNRTGTRLTGFNAAPEPVRKGHTLSTSGTLQKLSGTKWVSFAKQRVYLYFQPKGKKTYTYLGSTVTNAKGHFTRSFTAKQDGTWVAAWFTPNGSYVDAQSNGDYVDVR